MRITHGTLHAYLNGHCRCDECLAVGSWWNKARYRKRLGLPASPKPERREETGERMPWPASYFDLRMIAFEQRRDL